MARARWQSLQQRQQDLSSLVSEMEVQSRATDAARANVEHHYTYIHNQFFSFTQQ